MGLDSRTRVLLRTAFPLCMLRLPLLGKLGFNWDTGLRGASTGWSSDSHAPVTSLSVLTAGNAKRLGRPAALLPVVVLVAAGVAAVDWFPFDSSLLLE